MPVSNDSRELSLLRIPASKLFRRPRLAIVVERFSLNYDKRLQGIRG